MLHFFTKNKILNTPLFSASYIDIHSHIIPGIDDGSKNTDESVALLKRMQEMGIQHFVFTPHIMEGVWENSSEKIKQHFLVLKEHLATTTLKNINIRYAAEYMLDINFSNLVTNKDVLPIKDNKILVEMSYQNPPINLYEQLFQIQIAGYQPILAHPERYNFLHQNFKEYQKLKDAGCLFQLNLLSLTHYYGKQVANIALKLCENNMIDFVGSDTHHQKHLNALESLNTKKIRRILAPLLEKNEQLI
jgi:protein-tyrosine phosphatase